MKKSRKSTMIYFSLVALCIGALAVIAYGVYPDTNQEGKENSVLGAAQSNYELKEGDPSINLSRKWLLKGLDFNDEYSESVYTLKFEKKVPLDENPKVQVLGTGKDYEMVKGQDNVFITNIQSEDLEPGTYKLQAEFAINSENYKTNKINLNVSYPLYAVWTMDWEGANVSDSELKNLENFSDDRGIPISHLFNPRIYISESFSSERADDLTDWIKDRERKGDDIGLHLHMHKDLVNASGVDPKDGPTWTNYIEDGHDIPCSEYSYNEFVKILQWSKNAFVEAGLDSPKYFRAGGWFANLDNIKALNDSGFIIDTSGREKYIWGSEGLPGYWDLEIETQPYQISKVDQNKSTEDNFNIWEFPNNGGDSLYYTSDELVDRFNSNYTSDVLDKGRVFTLLSHPHQISKDIQVLTPLYDHMDEVSAINDKGPVIYTTLLDTYNGIVEE